MVRSREDDIEISPLFTLTPRITLAAFTLPKGVIMVTLVIMRF
jgi:hypothetical protein